MLAKLRHYVNLETLKNIYYSVFHSHLVYACQIWGQVSNSLLTRTQNKAVRIMCFKSPRANSSILYTKLKILRYFDYVEILNCLFVYDCIKNLLPNIFKGTMNYVSHHYNTRAVSNKHLELPRVKTTKYGFIRWPISANNVKTKSAQNKSLKYTKC